MIKDMISGKLAIKRYIKACVDDYRKTLLGNVTQCKRCHLFTLYSNVGRPYSEFCSDECRNSYQKECKWCGSFFIVASRHHKQYCQELCRLAAGHSRYRSRQIKRGRAAVLADRERNKKIFEEFTHGKTFAQIARKYKFTDCRARQIVAARMPRDPLLYREIIEKREQARTNKTNQRGQR